MTPAALWLITTIAFVVGAGLIAWAVLRRARPALHVEVFIWLAGSIALLVFTFWAFALVFGHGQLPNSQEDPDWLRSVILAAAPTAGLIGASVAVAISIRKQRTSEVADELATVRALRERFNTCAEQLAHDSSAVRLAGVYALAALADDWNARGDRTEAQVCIDLLCAYQRSPRLEPLNFTLEKTPTQQAETDVRVTITALISSHLRRVNGFPPAWSDYRFPLSGAVFDDGDHNFNEITITGRTVIQLDRATFKGLAMVRFYRPVLSGGRLSFTEAAFRGGRVRFLQPQFKGSSVSFNATEFSGGTVRFIRPKFSAGVVSFANARFFGGNVTFGNPTFDGGALRFEDAQFSGGEVTGPWEGAPPAWWPPGQPVKVVPPPAQ